MAGIGLWPLHNVRYFWIPNLQGNGDPLEIGRQLFLRPQGRNHVLVPAGRRWVVQDYLGALFVPRLLPIVLRLMQPFLTWEWPLAHGGARRFLCLVIYRLHQFMQTHWSAWVPPPGFGMCHYCTRWRPRSPPHWKCMCLHLLRRGIGRHPPQLWVRVRALPGGGMVRAFHDAQVHRSLVCIAHLNRYAHHFDPGYSAAWRVAWDLHRQIHEHLSRL